VSLLSLLSQPGSLVQRSQTGPEDEYGTPTWVEVNTPIVCHVQPRTSEELLQAASAGITTWKGWFPAGTLVDPADALLLDDGRQFEFVGPPRPWVNPTTGTEQFIESDLNRVERPEGEESS
jgi:hypothetical protein